LEFSKCARKRLSVLLALELVLTSIDEKMLQQWLDFSGTSKGAFPDYRLLNGFPIAATRNDRTGRFAF
jgi:hypothetical protein